VPLAPKEGIAASHKVHERAAAATPARTSPTRIFRLKLDEDEQLLHLRQCRLFSEQP